MRQFHLMHFWLMFQEASLSPGKNKGITSVLLRECQSLPAAISNDTNIHNCHRVLPRIEDKLSGSSTKIISWISI